MNDVERAFRQAHGQAVATLTRIFADITLAEDAVQDAFLIAVHRWPNDGVPDNPAGWIVTTARNRAVDVVRRDRRGRELTEQIATDPLVALNVLPVRRTPRSCGMTSCGSSSPVATRPSGSSIRWL